MTELHSHERAHAMEDLGTRQPEAEEHGSKDRGATYVMKNCSAVPPNGAYRRIDITKDLSAPRYPAGARAGAAPD